MHPHKIPASVLLQAMEKIPKAQQEPSSPAPEGKETPGRFLPSFPTQNARECRSGREGGSEGSTDIFEKWELGVVVKTLFTSQTFEHKTWIRRQLQGPTEREYPSVCSLPGQDFLSAKGAGIYPVVPNFHPSPRAEDSHLLPFHLSAPAPLPSPSQNPWKKRF